MPHGQVGVELRVDLEHGAVLAVIRRPPRVERDQLVVEAGVVVRAQVQVGHGSAWLGLIDHLVRDRVRDRVRGRDRDRVRVRVRVGVR